MATNRDPTNSVDLEGTNGDDVIVGREGMDRIAGRGGNDLICSGSGDDYVMAGAGNDRVKTQTGIDTAIGNDGRDRMWGGPGPVDSLRGGAGNDRLFGGLGQQDSLIGGAGDDLIDGGNGYDLAEFWDSPGPIEADLGTDTATGRGNDTIVSIEGLVGSNYDDVLIGDDLTNLLQGNFGNDVLRALGSATDGGTEILRSGGGDDLLDGGEGPDTASYNLSPWPVDADLARGTTIAVGYGTDTLENIENLTGSKMDDTLAGDGGNNIVIGNGGDDVMDGGGGTDELGFGEARAPVEVDLGAGTADADWWGSDTFENFEDLAGSVWADVLIGDDGRNFVWGGSGGDSLSGRGGDDILIGSAGTDDANGGADSDACEAETEVECELDVPPGRRTHRSSRPRPAPWGL